MEFTAANSANAGRINLLGGIAEFTQPLTNAAAGEIIGNGTLIVDGTGLTNNGQVLLSGGTTYIYGNVNNNTGTSSSGILITGNAGITFWNNVTNTGSSLFKVTMGSLATFFGTYNGAGATGGGMLHFEGSLSPGFSPASDIFDNSVVFGPELITKMEIGGITPGTQFDQIHVTGQLELDGTLQVSLINGFTPSAGQSFDLFDWGTLSGKVLVDRAAQLERWPAWLGYLAALHNRSHHGDG